MDLITIAILVLAITTIMVINRQKALDIALQESAQGVAGEYLVYNGYIAPRVVEQIQVSGDNGYTHWIEVTSWPDRFTNEWADENLLLYPKTNTDCNGQDYPATSHRYCIHNNLNDGPTFVGFVTEGEAEKFCDAFPEVMVCRNPFLTEFWMNKR